MKLAILFICLFTPLASHQTTNHAIKFIGMRNGLDNETVAASELQSHLRRVTGQQIVVDSLDANGATWHSQSLYDHPEGECPEDKIRQLVATIQDENGYTREFKMQLTEDFEPPASVTIDWLDSCENVARKRTLDSAQQDPNLSQSSSSTPNVETPDPPSDEAPTTTVEPPTSLAPVESPTTTLMTPTTQNNIDETTSEGFNDLLLPLDMATIRNELTEATTNATTEAAAETTTRTATTTTTTQAATTITTTTVGRLESDELSTKRIPDEQSVQGAEKHAAVEAPHYGKYIGFAAASLLFLAYIICSRSYRRQGMYELRSE